MGRRADPRLGLILARCVNELNWFKGVYVGQSQQEHSQYSARIKKAQVGDGNGVTVRNAPAFRTLECLTIAS